MANKENKKLYELTTEYNYQRPEEYCYNDEVGEMRYHSSVNETRFSSPIYFDSRAEIFKWCLDNDETISEIRVIEYIGDYLGVSDVVKIRVYGKDNENKYCTAVNETFNIEYVKELKCWYPSDEKIKDIYDALEKRGIVLKHNVFKEHIDLKDNFEVDRSNPHFPPWLRPSSKEAKEDQVLKRSLKKPVIHIGYI